MAGVAPLLKVCGAFAKFHQCMGPVNEKLCLNPIHVYKHTQDIQQVYYWLAIMEQLHFQCGAGLMLAIKDWTCIVTGDNNLNYTLHECRENFTLAWSNNPVNSCKHGSGFLNCVHNYYTTQCNHEVGWWFCEGVRRGLNIALPPCQFRCSVMGGSALGRFISSDQEAANAKDAAKNYLESSEEYFQMISDMTERLKQNDPGEPAKEDAKAVDA
jgi:hypothetical protein